MPRLIPSSCRQSKWGERGCLQLNRQILQKWKRQPFRLYRLVEIAKFRGLLLKSRGILHSSRQFLSSLATDSGSWFARRGLYSHFDWNKDSKETFPESPFLLCAAGDRRLPPNDPRIATPGNA